MKAELAKAIMSAAEVIGLELEHRAEYSGRGMYGKSTDAVIGDQGDFLQACCYAAGTLDAESGLGLDELCDAVRNLRSDSMGRYSTVWY